MPLIYLSQGKVALIDDDDLALVEQYRWCAHEHGHPGKPRYEAVTNLPNGKQLKMHRLIMDPPIGLVVDHLNGDQLDNRRANLRVCTPRENLMNQVGRTNKISRFPGVSRQSGRRRWSARASFGTGGKNEHTFYLGSFDSEEEAAAAYAAFVGEL